MEEGLLVRLHFEDDTAIIAKTQEELQDMVNRLAALEGSMA